MAVLHHSRLHTVQGPGELGSQEMFAVELGGELEGGAGAELASQEEEVAHSGAAGHHPNLSLSLLPHVDGQLLPVQNIQGGGDGVPEYRVESSAHTRVRASSD